MELEQSGRRAYTSRQTAKGAAGSAVHHPDASASERRAATSRSHALPGSSAATAPAAATATGLPRSAPGPTDGRPGNDATQWHPPRTARLPRAAAGGQAPSSAPARDTEPPPALGPPARAADYTTPDHAAAPAGGRRAATDLDTAEWAAYLAAAGEPAYRARQIRHHLFRRHTVTFAAMAQLPAALRERLERDLTPYGLAERSRTRSRDGLTTKLLLQAADGHTVEAVSIREPLPPDPRRVRRARHTVCISSQVGCAMGCIFCASGIGGVARNLTAGEMLDQVAIVQREFGPLTNLVFMGMGEPLANYPALRRALAVLCDRDGFGFSARRITVSTVGLVSGIERLARDGLPVGLAVSLHAADDHLRRRLVPTAGRWPVAEIVAAAAACARATGRTVTFEYVLLAGINDAVADAERLAALLHRHAPAPAKVNAIPYNPVPEFAHLRRPAAARVHAFVQALRRRAVPVTVRKEKGQEVAAACGQLRRQLGSTRTTARVRRTLCQGAHPPDRRTGTLSRPHPTSGTRSNDH
ncbi:MAG: 23S rRNA (adenine(2503)-C(2))-methyltransferase RlmN [Spirochaetaceae bacterium]|nr:23S rRNA (adenine(2503)-C(2))-methyltransferase RlmN [Spirochaetaceae bacterium]